MALLFVPGALLAAVSGGFRVPEGFEVTLFAGDDLASDIHCMTADHAGRIVVASRGWVKTLHDTDGDGKADQATTFAAFPKSGAQGLYMDQDGLVVSGDQGVRRWRDRDGDGKADGEPELFFRTAGGGEHGPHAIMKGPDGWFYLMAGNETGISVEHATLPSSPVKRVTAGAIVRFSPEGRGSEVLAHGFRNPYAFDFHPFGQILTYESDGERDDHLPWYSGTKIIDVAIGAEHGWVLKGSPHAWSRPESWFDNSERLRTVGRGSPTGVLVYRHRAFPARYREGVFALCWTTGRVYFSPLVRAGATFRAELETFIEVDGATGFAPVAAVVGPSGDLFVAIGGRGTLGSVFRVHYKGSPDASLQNGGRLREVLTADQPLASWSRARWVPQAKQLGANEFEAAAANPALPLPERIRAVEVLVEIFGGLGPETAERLATDSEPELVARVAWAVPRSVRADALRANLAALTRRDEPRIARAAWEALQSVPSGSAEPAFTPDWYRGLDSAHRRVRAATVLAARGSGHASFSSTLPPAHLTDRQALGQLKIFGAARPEVPEWTAHFFHTCVAVFTRSLESDTRLDAIRLLQLGLGDVSPVPSRPETYDGFVGANTHEISIALRAHVVRLTAPAFPTNDAELDRELGRLLAVLSAEVPGLIERLVAKISAASTLEDDIYYLMSIARLPGARADDTRGRIARAVAGIHHKMSAARKQPSRYWALHVAGMLQRLLARDPALASALVAAPNFDSPAQAVLAEAFPVLEKEAAARALLARSARASEPQRAWTREFVELLTVLPETESFPAFRAGWSITSLHDPLAMALARNPQAEDRVRFVAALGSFQPAVVERAATALLKIGGRGASSEVSAAIVALRRHCRLQKESSVRGTLVELLATWTGQSFVVTEGADLLRSYMPWFEWFAATYPGSDGSSGPGDDNLATWIGRLAVVHWENGDPGRGRRLYEERACHSCHGASRIGPDLKGITTRFARDDLFTKVLMPSREISPAWKGMEFTMANGATHIGVIVYESPTTTLLQTGPDTTLRLPGEDVVAVRPSRISIMPPGLLNGLRDDEVADFYAFMKTFNN